MTSKSLEKFFENIALLETREDVLAVSRALRERLDQIERRTASDLFVGAKIKVSGKKAAFEGVIIKINQKTVRVRDSSNRKVWIVSPSLITVIN